MEMLKLSSPAVKKVKSVCPRSPKIVAKQIPITFEKFRKIETLKRNDDRKQDLSYDHELHSLHSSLCVNESQSNIYPKDEPAQL